MTDRTELLESVLDSLAEGVAVADHEGCVALWNRAAENITGLASGEIVGHRVREVLDALVVGGAQHWIKQTDAKPTRGHGSLVQARHKMGHGVPVMARVLVLRDKLGARIGTGVVFHPVEAFDALPHGESDEDSNIRETQEEVEDRLGTMHEDFLRSDIPLGVLWVTVDQARSLRRTHGARACEAMLEKVERTLAGGLKPAELRVLLLAFLKGTAPMIAIELGRRAIPARVRPTFDEMEKHCKGQGAGVAEAPAKAA